MKNSSAKGYKTVIFNIVALIGSVATMIGADIPPEQLDTVSAGLVALITVGNVILRAVTNSPIFKK